MSTITPGQQDAGWTVDRKLLVGLITFVVPMAISCLMAFTDVRARVSVIEATHAERIEAQKNRDDHQDAELKEKFDLIQKQLDALNQKMDKVVDRVNTRQ